MILPRHPDADCLPPNLRELRAIGYWSDDVNPRSYVDPSWDPAERARVIAHVRNGAEAIHWRGVSYCRFGCVDDEIMGSRCLTDGVFVWPEGFAHYLEHHHVRPPAEFVQHVPSPQPQHRRGPLARLVFYFSRGRP